MARCESKLQVPTAITPRLSKSERSIEFEETN
jgi:hypothetical protein